ncbi:hypothetical protein EKO04_010088 [Ascochyta lentis]|uniref:Uncharacterized protein n=1 Tax=Ascochyta lentis TaxID=205686 RepID=A0A8H7IZ61_9PLEO|nr:hypothetical protein EKO04_010088 [Ascochyta lentis]
MSTTSAGCIPEPRCCCGSSDCVFLAHNGRLLDGLERDVSKAAQLGQALLVRHEAYVADSERERRQMLANIERLENEKLELEAKNAQTIKQNRDLLDQLEQLNESVGSSDAQIQALQDTLRSTEEELQRLASLSARTQLLEAQLFDLEREQTRLQHNLDTKTVDERTAIQRWQKAERTLGDLQDQIDRIEREAREERERHVEVVARMERRMAVESELNTAAARLKAKAGQERGGSTVVSHFVKDILLDNANLQHGILELREMLVNSNEEVERLRDQLRVHQPVSTSPTQEVSRTTLDKEIDLETEVVEPIGGQELHIHHHYHGSKPGKSLLPKVQAQRRHSKKKRFSLTSGHFDPAPSLNRNSTATILSQTAVTVPNSHRWSQATTLGPGSLPSSPVSDSHRGSMYDRVFSDVAYDSSRPTSPPDSIDMHSPMFGSTKSNDFSFDSDSTSRHHRRSRSRTLKPPMMLSTVRSASTPIAMTTKSAALAVISAVSSPAGSYTDNAFALSPTPSTIPEQAAIPEENESASISVSEHALVFSPDEVETDNDLLSPIKPARPALRRHASHESLISISGMDIHTLQSRPAQLLMSNHSRFSTPKGAGSVGPELTPWTATAHGSLSQGGSDSNDSRSFLYSTIANQKRGPRKSEGPPSGKSSGGWFFGKWGATPTSTSTSPATSPALRPTSSESRQTDSSQDTAKATTPEPSRAKSKAAIKPTPAKPKLRPSGVNQNGPIWGFFDSIPETPTNVVVMDYDAEALGEALNDRSPPRIIDGA